MPQDLCAHRDRAPGPMHSSRQNPGTSALTEMKSQDLCAYLDSPRISASTETAPQDLCAHRDRAPGTLLSLRQSPGTCALKTKSRDLCAHRDRVPGPLCLPRQSPRTSALTETKPQDLCAHRDRAPGTLLSLRESPRTSALTDVLNEGSSISSVSGEEAVWPGSVRRPAFPITHWIPAD